MQTSYINFCFGGQVSTRKVVARYDELKRRLNLPVFRELRRDTPDGGVPLRAIPSCPEKPVPHQIFSGRRIASDTKEFSRSLGFPLPLFWSLRTANLENVGVKLFWMKSFESQTLTDSFFLFSFTFIFSKYGLFLFRCYSCGPFVTRKIRKTCISNNKIRFFTDRFFSLYIVVGKKKHFEVDSSTHAFINNIIPSSILSRWTHLLLTRA